MNKELEKLIRDLLEKGFTISGVTLSENGDLQFELQGFYKSGSVKIYADSNYIYALARYNEITELNYTNPFDSLVNLNYEWWQKSKSRYEGWSQPNSDWLPYLIEKGLVTEKTITTYE